MKNLLLAIGLLTLSGCTSPRADHGTRVAARGEMKILARFPMERRDEGEVIVRRTKSGFDVVASTSDGEEIALKKYEGYLANSLSVRPVVSRELLLFAMTGASSQSYRMIVVTADRNLKVLLDETLEPNGLSYLPSVSTNQGKLTLTGKRFGSETAEICWWKWNAPSGRFDPPIAVSNDHSVAIR